MPALLPKMPVPVEAIAMEIHPATLNDIAHLVYESNDDEPTALVPFAAIPLWAPVPANFWLCETCWRIWARGDLQYVDGFFIRQDGIIMSKPPNTSYHLHECTECKGKTCEYYSPLSTDEQGPVQMWFTYVGYIDDDQGRWFYVGGMTKEEANMGDGCIVKITLIPLEFFDTPSVAFYRIRNWTPGWNLDFYKRRLEWETRMEYPSKKARAATFPKNVGEGPPPLHDNRPEDFQLCEDCLGIWVKGGAPYGYDHQSNHALLADRVRDMPWRTFSL